MELKIKAIPNRFEREDIHKIFLLDKKDHLEFYAGLSDKAESTHLDIADLVGIREKEYKDVLGVGVIEHSKYVPYDEMCIKGVSEDDLFKPLCCSVFRQIIDPLKKAYNEINPNIKRVNFYCRESGVWLPFCPTIF